MLTAQRAAHHLPQSSVQLDPNNPDTASIVDAWMPGYSTKGLVSGADTAVGIEFNRIVTPRGPGLNVRSNGLRYPGNTLDGQSVAWLVLAWRDGSGDTNCSIAKKDVSVIPAQEWDGNVRTIVWGPQNAAAVAYGTTDKFRNKLTAFCGVFGPNEQAAFYDTQPTFDLSGAGAGSSAVIRTTGNQFTIGAADNGGEVAYPWTTVLVVLWQGARLPSVARMRAYAQNPSLLFRQRALPVFPQAAPKVAAVLGGTASAVASAYGTLSTSIRLAGKATATVTAGGALSTVIQLTGAAQTQASASGSLSTGIQLAGAAQAQASGTGALTTAIPLSGSAQAQASASGALVGSNAGLSGTARAEATATGALTTGIRLAGVGAAQASASGSLSTGIVLSGAAAAVAIASGALSTAISLGGAGLAQASAAGVLTTSIRLVGGAAATASSSGALTTRIALSGAAMAVASAYGALTSGAAPAPVIDISQISPAHIAVFDGTGSRIAVFGGTGARTGINGMTMKLPAVVNGKMQCDRDPDEISWYGADITQELNDRATTPVDASKVVPVLSGVALLDGPQIQTAVKDNVTRTYIVVRLGPVDGALPDNWGWIARVPCVNGERFDKSTYFNRVDT